MRNTNFLILNSDLVEASEARISPINRGMMYGDGCFETLKVYQGRFLAWQKHFERLCGALNYLNLSHDFNPNGLKENLTTLLKENGLQQKEAMIRIQCWREDGRGYHTASTKMNWLVQVNKVEDHLKPLKLTVADTRCIPNASLKRKYKLSNGLNFIKAAQEVDSGNFDDALMLTLDGLVSETTISNIFWIREGKIYTPAEHCDLLPGITRSLVMSALHNNKIEIETGEFKPEHLLGAEAVFCTNSVREIQQVEQIDGHNFENGHPLVKKILILFDEYKHQLLLS